MAKLKLGTIPDDKPVVAVANCRPPSTIQFRCTACPSPRNRPGRRRSREADRPYAGAFHGDRPRVREVRRDYIQQHAHRRQPEEPAVSSSAILAHECDKPANRRIFGLRTPHQLNLHPSVLLADRSIDNTWECGLCLTIRGEGNSKSRPGQREHTVLACRMAVEPSTVTHQRGVKCTRRLNVVPALNEKSLFPQAAPIEHLLCRRIIRGIANCQRSRDKTTP